MALSKDEILEAIAEMSVMDIVELIEAMEEKFGVTAAAAVAAAPAAAAGGDAGGAAEEKTEFDVVLTSAGEKKVNVIKVIYSLDDILRPFVDRIFCHFLLPMLRQKNVVNPVRRYLYYIFLALGVHTHNWAF